jgi:phosphoribosylanthranilate isomerase
VVWIKICGTTSLADGLAAARAGADALGFVFAPGSPRQLSPDDAVRIIQHLPAGVEKVGVFVNEDPARIREIARHAGLTAIQLHGDEPPGVARDLRSEFRVVKAIAAGPDLAGRAARYIGAADVVLLDSAPCPPGAANPNRGGTGRQFDWSEAAAALQNITAPLPIIVAGGLSPGNVAQAMEELRPWGVDVCSGVERVPGTKDEARLRAFVAAVRTAERSWSPTAAGVEPR